MRDDRGKMSAYIHLRPYAFDASPDILSEDPIRRRHRRNVKLFSDAIGGHERIEEYFGRHAWNGPEAMAKSERRRGASEPEPAPAG